MKTLYLLRHAKAEAGERDFERNLSARGESDAERMGRALKGRGIQPAIVYCSTASRARQTLEIFLPCLGGDIRDARFDDDLYLAAPEYLAECVAGINDSHESALICGHNPGLECLADFYMDSGPLELPTCSFFTIRFNTDSWAFAAPETAGETLRITPKSLR